MENRSVFLKVTQGQACPVLHSVGIGTCRPVFISGGAACRQSL